MIGGTVYATAGSRRAVVALDAATGELLWMHREDEGARGETAPRALSGRGLSYWRDGDDERIIYVTPGYRMIALDAETGETVAEFGDDGVVDLKLEADQDMDSDRRRDRPACDSVDRRRRHRHRCRALDRLTSGEPPQREGLHPRL